MNGYIIQKTDVKDDSAQSTNVTIFRVHSLFLSVR